MYHYARGVPQDYAEAVKWYRKAAEQSLAEAQYNIGYHYTSMPKACSQDYAKAVKWYPQGGRPEPEAEALKITSGNMYRPWPKACSQDYAEAVKWFRKART